MVASAVPPSSTRSSGGALAAGAQQAVQRARGEGQPMAAEVRAPLEAAFGADFARVRIHTGPQADRLSRSFNAQAFTLGGDIFFGNGMYRPNAASGKHLLAHELTHSLQQGAGKANKIQTKLQVGPAGDGFEREADRAADSFLRAPHGRPAVQGRLQTTPAPAGRVQRRLSQRAEDALDYANQMQPGFTQSTLPGLADEKTWLQQAQWLPEKTTDQVIRVRSWLEKRTQNTDQAQEDRMMLAKAYLLKIFVTEWYLTIQGRRAKGKFQQLTDELRKAAIPAAMLRVEKEKKRLQALGLNKPGAVKPEFMAMARESYTAERDNPAGLNFFVPVDRNILGHGSNVDTTPSIEWRGTRVPSSGFLRSVGLKLHSIILYNGADGVRKYISAHANAAQPPLLEATQGLYTPAVDSLWEPTAAKMKLETGPQVEDKFEDLENAADQVNALGKKYKLFTNNCNRAAYHILKTAGVRTKQPPGLFFGWGKRLSGANDQEEAQGDGGQPVGDVPKQAGEQTSDPEYEGLQLI
jgi:hypothetical protein